MAATPSHSRQAQRAAHLGEPPRRTMPVAHVWAVMAIALLVGAFLNAPGIRKTALGQPVGWRRDLATFFVDPVADASHALYLDRPRAALKWMIGRSGDDAVDFSLPSPTIPDGGAPAAAPPKRAYSPDQQLALYVAGDSLAITPGESVINQALGTGVIGLVGPVDGHVSTGLARPEVFNWPGYLAEILPPSSVGALVLTIGSNDDQTLTGDNGVGPFGTPEWEAEYRRRVGGLMDQVTGSGTTTLFWVGIPQMRNTERFDTRYRLINEIVRNEAAKRAGKVVWVDAEAALSPLGGGYADYLENLDGTVVQVRTGDGIHFTRAGGDRIAAAVLEALNDTFDLESWRTRTPGTTTTSTPGTTTTTKARAKGGK